MKNKKIKTVNTNLTPVNETLLKEYLYSILLKSTENLGLGKYNAQDVKGFHSLVCVAVCVRDIIA